MYSVQSYSIVRTDGIFRSFCNSFRASASALVFNIGKINKCGRICDAKLHSVVYVYSDIASCKLVLFGVTLRSVKQLYKLLPFIGIHSSR